MSTHHSQKPRISGSRLRPFVLLLLPPLLLFLSIQVYNLQITLSPLLFSLRTGSSPRYKVRNLKCIRVMKNLMTREGIGAFFKLNQLAVLLASYYQAQLAFPDIESVHGYNFRDLFSTCGPPDDAAFPKKCLLVQDDLAHHVCPSADCDCLAGQLREKLQEIVDRGCPTVGVVNDGFKRQEFSGCLSVLRTYFGSVGKPPDWQYDAIHYRQGDLAVPGGGGKAFKDIELYFIVKEMCKMSDRDIVVVTEGSPHMPECGDRIVLADTSIQHAMQIFQYAKHVSVGVSSFAHILLEMGKPERVFMKIPNTMRFEWVDCEKWTLFDMTTGATFLFESKKAMLDIISSVRDLRIERKARPIDKVRAIEFNMTVPKRMWSPEMMKPAILRD